MCSFLIRTEFGHKTSIYPQILVLFAYIQIFVQLGHIIDICSPCSPQENRIYRSSGKNTIVFIKLLLFWSLLGIVLTNDTCQIVDELCCLFALLIRVLIGVHKTTASILMAGVVVCIFTVAWQGPERGPSRHSLWDYVEDLFKHRWLLFIF